MKGVVRLVIRVIAELWCRAMYVFLYFFFFSCFFFFFSLSFLLFFLSSFSPPLLPPLFLYIYIRWTGRWLILSLQTLPACGGPPKPSKVCVTADDSWYCPPGDTCGTTRGSCYSIFNTCVPGKVDPPSPTTPPGTPGGSNSGSSNGGGSSSGSQSNEGVGQPRILWSEGIMALGAAVFVVIL